MKGTIRIRENRDGSKSYVCQVKLGRDPGTGKARVLTGTAKSERAADRLVHELIAKADDRSQHASDATVATVIEQWLATGGPAGEATRQVYAGYIRLHVLPTLGDVPLRKLGVKGLSPASIRKAHTIVRAALAQAVRWGWPIRCLKPAGLSLPVPSSAGDRRERAGSRSGIIVVMNETTFSFAADDGSDIAVYRWSGDWASKAVVQIAPGMGEHAASTSSRRVSTIGRTHVDMREVFT